MRAGLKSCATKVLRYYRRSFVRPDARLFSRRLGVILGYEVAVVLDVNFEPDGAVRTVDQPAIRRASVGGVERDGCQARAIVGFPFVAPAVPVRVCFSAVSHGLLIVLDAVDLSVATRGHLN